MDTTRDIVYRTFTLNDSTIDETIDANGKIAGSTVDSVDMSDVDVVQFLEKRSLQDGMDAGDAFLGARRIRMTGTLYDVSRPLLYDRHWEFLAALNPVLAQREVPLDKGYRDLTFGVPTANTDDAVVDSQELGYPSGVIDLRALALPRARQVIWQRDQQGGVDGDALALPWAATFLMKDPNLYSQLPRDYALSGGGTIVRTMVNRGTYIATLEMLVEVGAAAGSIAIAAGGANLTITVPASSGDRLIRYKGRDKMLTVEENDVEVPRFDLLNLGSAQAHPIVPPGQSPMTITFTTVVPQAGSHIWFYETYAG